MARGYNPSLAAQQTPDGKRYLKPIRAMTPYERLVYWIKERHSIHLKRFTTAQNFKKFIEKQPDTKAANCFGERPPYTQDPILQNVFFCSPYRENDKVTAYLRNYTAQHRAEENIFLGTILLRWYNHIPTMQRLIKAGIPQSFTDKERVGNLYVPDRWLHKAYSKLLIPLRDAGEQMFGGAYIIRPVLDGPDGKGVRKVEAIGQLMTKMAKTKDLYKTIVDSRSMAVAESKLREFAGMGPFYVYQFIGDLAFTHVLDTAKDWFTWGFCGPGTARGLTRLEYDTGKLPDTLPRNMKPPNDALQRLRGLQENVNDSLKLGPPPKKPPRGGEVRKMEYIHMRDLCNCLCEYDKYERALFNERDLKRPYHGT